MKEKKKKKRKSVLLVNSGGLLINFNCLFTYPYKDNKILGYITGLQKEGCK